MGLLRSLGNLHPFPAQLSQQSAHWTPVAPPRCANCPVFPALLYFDAVAIMCVSRGDFDVEGFVKYTHTHTLGPRVPGEQSPQPGGGGKDLES